MNKPKPFYKSKTVITAVIMFVSFVIDAAFSLGISDTIDTQLSAIFTADEAGNITKINFSALFTLVSMLTLRLMTKQPVTFKAESQEEKRKYWVDKIK
jgi:amino acid permease